MKLKLLCFALTACSVMTSANLSSTNSSELLKIDTNDSEVTSLNSNLELPIPFGAITRNEIQRVRIRFSAEDGLRRPLLLGFTPNNAASDGVDYGYDALSHNEHPNDLFWDIEGLNYIIQGVGSFNESNMYPFRMNINNAGSVAISLTDLENFDTDVNVFIYDSYLNVSTAINSADYQITLEPGLYVNRFYIAFESNETNVLSTSETQLKEPVIRYLLDSNEIHIKMSEFRPITAVRLLNITGSEIKRWDNIAVNRFNDIRIHMNDIADGVYILNMQTDVSSYQKKILIRN